MFSFGREDRKELNKEKEKKSTELQCNVLYVVGPSGIKLTANEH